MSLSLRYVARSEVGLVRKNNQDSGYASPTMLIVADGMGGAAAGDLASAVAIKELQAADGHYEGEQMIDVLAATIAAANDRIADLVVHDHSLEGMGTTVCGGMFDGQSLGIAHIGDSRGYIVRDGALKRLTRDHSWVQQLIDEGRISEQEALTHPHRSLILRVVNGQPMTEPEFDLIELQEGDRLLFCSDGLCGLVDDEDIAVALGNSDLDKAIELLVELAHLGGGLDNITIVMADVVSEEVDLEPIVLGAAATREVPDPATSPIDLGADDDDTEDTLRIDRAGNRVPKAPPPSDTEASERARYAPTVVRKKGRWLRITLAILVPILAITAALGVWYGISRNQYFIGAYENSVTIYRGVPDQIGGLKLFEVYEKQDTLITDLPPRYAEQVRGNQFPTGTLDDARRTAAELKEFSRKCIEQRERRSQQTQPPSPNPTTTTPQPTTTSTGMSPTTSASTLTPSPSLSTTPSSAPDEC